MRSVALLLATLLRIATTLHAHPMERQALPWTRRGVAPSHHEDSVPSVEIPNRPPPSPLRTLHRTNTFSGSSPSLHRTKTFSGTSAPLHLPSTRVEEAQLRRVQSMNERTPLEAPSTSVQGEESPLRRVLERASTIGRQHSGGLVKHAIGGAVAFHLLNLDFDRHLGFGGGQRIDRNVLQHARADVIHFMAGAAVADTVHHAAVVAARHTTTAAGHVVAAIKPCVGAACDRLRAAHNRLASLALTRPSGGGSGGTSSSEGLPASPRSSRRIKFDARQDRMAHSRRKGRASSMSPVHR